MIKKILFFTSIIVLFMACTHDVEVIQTFFPDGSKKIVHYYISNTMDSSNYTQVYFYKNGQRYVEGKIVNFKKNGEWKSWRNDGKLWSTSEYSSGIEDGPTETYHENGNLYYKGTYKKGARSGKWEFYDENGQRIKTIDYK